MSWVTYRVSWVRGLAQVYAVAGDIDLGRVASGLKDLREVSLVARAHADGLEVGTGADFSIVIENDNG